jgi:hypothetical protein
MRIRKGLVEVSAVLRPSRAPKALLYVEALAGTTCEFDRQDHRVSARPPGLKPRPVISQVDTGVISELRKRNKVNPRVAAFFRDAATNDVPLYVAAVTIGELRRGVGRARYRGDSRQGNLPGRWLDNLLAE